MPFLKHSSHVAGLTVIELLTSIFIIGLIMTVAMYSHQEFVDNLEIGNLSYAMALSIREAQTSGGAVRGFGGSFDYAYGVHFNPDGLNQFSGNDKAYIMFVDSSADKVYGRPSPPPPNYPGFSNCGQPGNPECLQIIDIGRGNFIDKICVRDSGVLNCDTTGTHIGAVDLTFLRPKLETNIRFRHSSNGQILQTLNDKEAVICLASPLNKKKSIHILHSGQISVEGECP